MSIQTVVTPVRTGQPTIAPSSPAGSVESNGQAKPIIYPDSDGHPMADNTKQFRTIVALHSGFEALYKDDPTVFVA
ncbi:MAG: hypothetical protein M3Q45_12445, partial [Chloroflexota bacterium]|nr:hypothetical protein [Chloroflexota bacterium]